MIEQRLISIERSLKGDDRRAVLLHEMIHAINYEEYGPQRGEGHGRRWQAEIRRVREAGEHCLHGEISHQRRWDAEDRAALKQAEQREQDAREHSIPLENQFCEVFGFSTDDIPYEPTEDDPVDPGGNEFRGRK